MGRVPKYSIIIPVKEINDYVRETVPYIQALELDDWELIIIPNNPELNEWEYDARISLISSGRVGPADKRDQASKKANGEILVFLDDDSYPKSDLLSVATTYFSDESVSAIGGPAITPESDSFWQKVSGAVFLTKLTGGNPERYVSMGKTKEIDDWPSVNFMVRKADFIDVGGFDSPYWPGEDTHLCLKLTRSSKRIIYVPDLIVWHHRRAGLVRHIKQVGAYGLHRGYFARHLPDTSRRLKFFYPTFVFVLTCSAGLIPLWPNIIDNILYFGFSLYFAVVLVGVLSIARLTSLTIAGASIIYVVGTHLSYGYQFAKGFLRTRPLNSKLR
jgi:GT2 family glycosyltransferase